MILRWKISLLVLTFAMAGFAKESFSQTNTLVSVSATGQVSNGSSWQSGNASEDGRFVVFVTGASNLVPNDKNGRGDVFVKDVKTGAISIVSVSSNGTQGNRSSEDGHISGDGNLVVFQSMATNLVAGDTNGQVDVFLHNRTTKVTTRISVSSTGKQGNGFNGDPRITRNGRFVGFGSTSNNLVAGDTNNSPDGFVRDLKNKTTIRVTLSSTGGQGNQASHRPYLSSDGRYAVFQSWATNLVTNDNNNKVDIFLRDTVKKTTRLISSSAIGVHGNKDSFLRGHRAISDDGRFVVFTSKALNLVPLDTNIGWDAFVKDVRTGNIVRVNVNSQGAQAQNPNVWEVFSVISGDGRFVVFDSLAKNLDPIDNNTHIDVFVRDTLLQTTKLISRNSLNQVGNKGTDYPSITANGRYTVFNSQATNLTSKTPSPYRNIYIRDRAKTFGFVSFMDGACGGVGDVPYFTSSSPILGGSITIGGENVAANSTGFVLLGLQAVPAIPLGGKCKLHINPAAYLILANVKADVQGRWIFKFVIPNIPAWVGAKVAVQVIFPGNGAFGIDFTNGLVWNFGE